MYCPRDNFGLTTKVLSGSEVHQCTSCHGLWISKDSILALADATHTPTLSQDTLNDKASAHFEAGTLKCPSDATQMLCKSIGQVEVDFCPSCHGIWLDKGELETLDSQPIVQPAKSHLISNALDALTYFPNSIDITAVDIDTSTLGEISSTLGDAAADTGTALLEIAGNNLDSIGDVISALIGGIADALN